MKTKKAFIEPELSSLGTVGELTLQGRGKNDGVNGSTGQGGFNGSGGGLANGKSPGLFDGNSQNTGGKEKKNNSGGGGGGIS